MASKSLGDIANNETLTVDVTVFDDDTGVAFDVSDFDAITFVIHDHKGGHSNAITVTDSDGIDTTQAADGILQVVVSADQMGALCAREYSWELHIKFDDGSEANAGQGTINVYEGYV